MIDQEFINKARKYAVSLRIAMQDQTAEMIESLCDALVDQEPIGEYVVRTDTKGKTNGIFYLKPRAHSLMDGSYLLYPLNVNRSSERTK